MPARDMNPDERIRDLERRVKALEVLVTGRLAALQPVGVAATTPGSVVKRWQIFDRDGVSLGYVAIYNTIT